MIVFRDVREQLLGSRLQAELLNELHSIQSAARGNSPIAFSTVENVATSALLRAGELECALTDLAEENPNSRLSEEVEHLAQVTDLISESLIVPAKAEVLAAKAQGIFQGVNCPESVRVSPPEGFCFYALHPLDYVELLNRIPLPPSRPVLVVGIRSMGTTLSSVVLSALKSRNVTSERITVRPKGHPYDRVTRLSESQRGIVSSYDQRSATFLVVDEGPGLSGSSFLSAADALHEVGISKDRIVFLCSRHSDPDALVAKDAATRWRSFHSYVVAPTRNEPGADALPLSGGDWRQQVFSLPRYETSVYRNAANWPAVWGQLSPAKYLSPDGKIIFKFEGLGRYGAAVRERAAICAEAGFGVAPRMAQNGFTEYPWAEGKLLSASDATPELLERVADYLAFRSREFRVSHADTAMLNEMTAFNFAMIADGELTRSPELVVERPVIADSRMMPYEWIKLDSGGQLVKLDCAAHGDNHFLPGPVDIAWDIAGTIIEWTLDGQSADYFLKCYERASGDRAGNRLQEYLLAYSAFQAGYSTMAISALAETDIEEQKRLLRDYEQYRCMVLKMEADRESQRIEVMSKTQRLPQPQSPVLQT